MSYHENVGIICSIVIHGELNPADHTLLCRFAYPPRAWPFVLAVHQILYDNRLR